MTKFLFYGSIFIAIIWWLAKEGKQKDLLGTNNIADISTHSTRNKKILFPVGTCIQELPKSYRFLKITAIIENDQYQYIQCHKFKGCKKGMGQDSIESFHADFTKDDIIKCPTVSD